MNMEKGPAQSLRLVICLALLPTFTSYAGERSPLAFSMSTEKTSYLTGEPVIASFALKNVSTNSVKVYREMGFLVGALKLQIQNGEGQVWKYDPLRGGVDLVNTSIALPPGEEIVFDEMLLSGLDNQPYCFPEPGTYRVTATIWVLQDLPLSNTITILVEAPKGIEKDAAAFLYGYDKAMVLHDFGHNPSVYLEFEEFLKRFPQSTFGVYVEYALAKSYTRTVGQRRADAGEAIRRFRAFVEKYPRSALADDAAIQISKWSAVIGDDEDVKTWSKKVIDEHPRSLLRFIAASTIQYVERHDSKPIVEKGTYLDKRFR